MSDIWLTVSLPFVDVLVSEFGSPLSRWAAVLAAPSGFEVFVASVVVRLAVLV